MTLTIELPEVTMANLMAYQHTVGRPAAEIAADVIAKRFSDDADEFPFDEESMLAMERGTRM